MAAFNAEGIEGLGLSFEQFAEIPDDVVDEMLEAGGKVTVEAHKQSIQALGIVDTGALRDSIVAHKKVGQRHGTRQRYVVVYPSGKHGKRNRRAVTKKYKRSKHGRTYTVGGDTVDVRNSEVGFIHEFGAPHKGIPAKGWMQKANLAAADDVAAAEMAVYHNWMDDIDL